MRGRDLDTPIIIAYVLVFISCFSIIMAVSTAHINFSDLISLHLGTLSYVFLAVSIVSLIECLFILYKVIIPRHTS